MQIPNTPSVIPPMESTIHGSSSLGSLGGQSVQTLDTLRTPKAARLLLSKGANGLSTPQLATVNLRKEIVNDFHSDSYSAFHSAKGSSPAYSSGYSPVRKYSTIGNTSPIKSVGKTSPMKSIMSSLPISNPTATISASNATISPSIDMADLDFFGKVYHAPSATPLPPVVSSVADSVPPVAIPVGEVKNSNVPQTARNPSPTDSGLLSAMKDTLSSSVATITGGLGLDNNAALNADSGSKGAPGVTGESKESASRASAGNGLVHDSRPTFSALVRNEVEKRQVDGDGKQVESNLDSKIAESRPKHVRTRKQGGLFTFGELEDYESVRSHCGSEASIGSYMLESDANGVPRGIATTNVIAIGTGQVSNSGDQGALNTKQEMSNFGQGVLNTDQGALHMHQALNTDGELTNDKYEDRILSSGTAKPTETVCLRSEGEVDDNGVPTTDKVSADKLKKLMQVAAASCPSGPTIRSNEQVDAGGDGIMLGVIPGVNPGENPVRGPHEHVEITEEDIADTLGMERYGQQQQQNNEGGLLGPQKVEGVQNQLGQLLQNYGARDQGEAWSDYGRPVSNASFSDEGTDEASVDERLARRKSSVCNESPIYTQDSLHVGDGVLPCDDNFPAMDNTGTSERFHIQALSRNSSPYVYHKALTIDHLPSAHLDANLDATYKSSYGTNCSGTGSEVRSSSSRNRTHPFRSSAAMCPTENPLDVLKKSLDFTEFKKSLDLKSLDFTDACLMGDQADNARENDLSAGLQRWNDSLQNAVGSPHSGGGQNDGSNRFAKSPGGVPEERTSFVGDMSAFLSEGGLGCMRSDIDRQIGAEDQTESVINDSLVMDGGVEPTIEPNTRSGKKHNQKGCCCQ